MSAFRSETGGARRTADAPLAGLTRARLAWLQATHRRGWAGVLWLCLAGAMALPAVLLVIDAAAVQSGLAQTLARDGSFTVRQGVADVDAFSALDRTVDQRVASRTGGALVPVAVGASIGPLRLMTVRGEQAPPALVQRPVSVAYAAHLSTHVQVVAGALPPDGLGGGEPAVSLPQTGADQLGLHLSDRLCIDLSTPGDPGARWCARIVGLWQPLDGRDPFWGGTVPTLQLTLGRYDLFELAKLRPAQPPVATLGYWADPRLVQPAGATETAARITALTADLRGPQRQVTTRLDASLRTFEARQLTASAAIHVMVAIVTVVGLSAVALVASRFLGTQSRELALLRARGWPRGRAWRVAFLGLGALALTAAPAGLLAGLLGATLLGATGSGLSAFTLGAADLFGLVAAVVVVGLGLVAVMAVLAAGAVWPEPEPSLRQRRRRQGGPLGGAAIGAAALGLLAMALPHLPGVGQLAANTPAASGLMVAPALGLVLLAAAAVWARPLSGWVPERASVPGTLAALQLERRPGQHAGAGFVLVLAAASAVFGALAIAAGLAPEQPALRFGVEIALAGGAVGALLLALAGFGMHFRSAARRRLREYAGLFAHGFAPADAVRSLADEQAATARAGLLAGCVLGVLLALSVLPMPAPTAALVGLAAAGVGAAAAVVTVGALVIGSISRRLPARVDPLAGPG